MDFTRQVYNLGIGGVPVHHEPVDADGICANPGNRELVRTGTPPTPAGCRMEAGAGSDDPDNDGTRNIYVPGHPFAIFIKVSNMGRNGCIKSWFCQYISTPMKYTVSVSTLQYKVGLTLSFLSLISWGLVQSKTRTPLLYIGFLHFLEGPEAG